MSTRYRGQPGLTDYEQALLTTQNQRPAADQQSSEQTGAVAQQAFEAQDLQQEAQQQSGAQAQRVLAFDPDEYKAKKARFAVDENRIAQTRLTIEPDYQRLNKEKQEAEKQRDAWKKESLEQMGQTFVRKDNTSGKITPIDATTYSKLQDERKNKESYFAGIEQKFAPIEQQWKAIEEEKRAIEMAKLREDELALKAKAGMIPYLTPQQKAAAARKPGGVNVEGDNAAFAEDSSQWTDHQRRLVQAASEEQSRYNSTADRLGERRTVSPLTAQIIRMEMAKRIQASKAALGDIDPVQAQAEIQRIDALQKQTDAQAKTQATESLVAGVKGVPAPVQTTEADLAKQERDQKGYEIAKAAIGTGVSAARLSGAQAGKWEGVKGELNEIGDMQANVAKAIGSAGFDINKAIEDANKRKTDNEKIITTSNSPGFGAPAKQSSMIKNQAGAQADAAIIEQLSGLKKQFEDAGITDPPDQKRIIKDTAKAEAWTEQDTDKTRVLSSGHVVFNPGQAFGQYDAMVKDIKAKAKTPELAAEAIARLDKARTEYAEETHETILAGEEAQRKVLGSIELTQDPLVRKLSGNQESKSKYQTYVEEQAAKGVTDKTALLDGYLKTQKDRWAIAKVQDVIGTSLAGGVINIGKTGVDAAASAAAISDKLTGVGRDAAKSLVTTSEELGDQSEALQEAGKLRGLTGAYGVGTDLGTTVTQMAPMIVGGQMSLAMKGMTQVVTRGLSVGGYAGAQGWSSMGDKAIRQEMADKKRKLTADEVVNLLQDPRVITAQFLNAAQTIALTYMIKGGPDRAALGHVNKGMTVRDFVAGGGIRAIRDGSFRKEIGMLGRNVYGDMAGEGVEEFTNEMLESFIAHYSDNGEMKMGDAIAEWAYAGALGALSGPIMTLGTKGPTREQRHAEILNRINQRIASPPDLDLMADAIAEVDPTERPATAEEIKEARLLTNPDRDQAKDLEKQQAAYAEAIKANDWQGARAISEAIEAAGTDVEVNTVRETADAVLLVRELAETDAQTKEDFDGAQQAFNQAMLSGDKLAKQEAGSALAVTRQARNEHLQTRAAVKIASGKDVSELTDAEIRAMGWMLKPDGSAYAPMNAKQLADVGLTTPLLRPAADGSVILTDDVVATARATSERAGKRIKLSEQEASQMAQQRATPTATTSAAPTAAPTDSLPDGPQAATPGGVAAPLSQTGAPNQATGQGPSQSAPQGTPTAGPATVSGSLAAGNTPMPATMDAAVYEAARQQNTALPEIPQAVGQAFAAGQPVSVSMQKQSGIDVPEGYTRQGSTWTPPTPPTNEPNQQGQAGSQGQAQAQGQAPTGTTDPSTLQPGTGPTEAAQAANQVAANVQATAETTFPRLKGKIRIESAAIDKNTGERVRTGGASAELDGGVTIYTEDIADQLAANPAETVESIVSAIVADHEVTHVAQVEAVRDIWKAQGSLGKFSDFFREWYGDMADQLAPKVFEAAREIYGQTAWDAQPKHNQAAEVVRMLVEASRPGADNAKFTELLRAVKLQQSPNLIETIRRAIEKLMEMLGAGNLPDSVREHIAAIEALYADLTADPNAVSDAYAAAMETINTAINAALKANPSVAADADLRIDIDNAASGLAQVMEGMPEAEHRDFIDSAIADWLAENAETVQKAAEAATQAEEAEGKPPSAREKAKAARKAYESRIRDKARQIINSEGYSALSLIYENGAITPKPNAIPLILARQKAGQKLTEKEMKLIRNQSDWNGLPRKQDYAGGGNNPIVRAILDLIMAPTGKGQMPNVMADQLRKTGRFKNMESGSDLFQQMYRELESISRGKPLDEDPDLVENEENIAKAEAARAAERAAEPVTIQQTAEGIYDEFGPDSDIAEKAQILATNTNRFDAVTLEIMQQFLDAEAGRIRAGVIDPKKWLEATQDWPSTLRKYYTGLATRSAAALRQWVESLPVIEEDAEPMFSSPGQNSLDFGTSGDMGTRTQRGFDFGDMPKGEGDKAKFQQNAQKALDAAKTEKAKENVAARVAEVEKLANPKPFIKAAIGGQASFDFGTTTGFNTKAGQLGFDFTGKPVAPAPAKPAEKTAIQWMFALRSGEYESSNEWAEAVPPEMASEIVDIAAEELKYLDAQLEPNTGKKASPRQIELLNERRPYVNVINALNFEHGEAIQKLRKAASQQAAPQDTAKPAKPLQQAITQAQAAKKITKSEAAEILKESEALKDRPIRTYEQAVAANQIHMGTRIPEWSAFPFTGEMSEGNPTQDTEGLQGMQHAPTLFPSNAAFGNGNCEWCGKQPIKNGFHIKHDGKKWTMVVGSECIGHFGIMSGLKMAAEAREGLALQTVQAVQDAAKDIYREFSFTRDIGYGRTERAWRSNEANTLYRKIKTIQGSIATDSGRSALSRWINARQEAATNVLAEYSELMARPETQKMMVEWREMKIRTAESTIKHPRSTQLQKDDATRDIENYRSQIAGIQGEAEAKPVAKDVANPSPTPSDLPSAETNTGAPPQAVTPSTPRPGEVSDFGQELDVRKNRELRAIARELSDTDIEGFKLSEIWPKKDVDAIEDTNLAAFAHAARAMIPAKPRTGYKLARWVKTVKMARELMVLVEQKGINAVIDRIRMEKTTALQPFADMVEVLSNVPREHWGRIEEVNNYPDAQKIVDAKYIPSPYARARVDGKGISATDLDGIIQKINEQLGGKEASKAPAMKFQVRQRRSDGRVFINKDGDPLRRSLKEFDDVKTAFAFINENQAELVKAWEEIKDRQNVKERDLRTRDNRPRVGKDYRNGRDVTDQMFMDDLGFRGVAFGEWVKQGKNAKGRQGMLNLAYDAFRDLADILGIPAKAVSLNGEIGLALGADGSGWASAHYRSDAVLINLTKTRGAGTLAHEWFHALDHYFQRKRPMKGKDTREGKFITYQPQGMYHNKSTGDIITPWNYNRLKGIKRYRGGQEYDAQQGYERVEGVRPQIEERFAALVQILKDSPMAKRAALIDKGKSDGYWSRIIEIAARSFENYTIAKMLQQGYHNDYLANVTPASEFSRDGGRYPYHLEEELAPVVEAFDNLFADIQTEETDKGIALFSSPVDKASAAAYLASNGTPDSEIEAESERVSQALAPNRPDKVAEDGTAYSQGDLFAQGQPKASSPGKRIAAAGSRAISRAKNGAGRDSISDTGLGTPAGPGEGLSAAGKKAAKEWEKRKLSDDLIKGMSGDWAALAREIDARGSASSIIADLINREIPVWNVNGTILDSPEAVHAVMLPIRSPYFESLKVMVLDGNLKTVHSQILTVGSVSESSAHPAEIFGTLARLREVHGKKYTSLVFSHNHPSGDPSPSKADESVTRRINEVAVTAGWNVFDHVITNGENYFSFREAGQISDTQRPENTYAPRKKDGVQSPDITSADRQAPWEAVKRSALKVIDTPEKIAEISKHLRNANPDAAHIIYTTTRYNILAVERVDISDVMDNRKLTQKLLAGRGREGAYGFIIDYKHVSQGNDAILARRVSTIAEMVMMKFIDAVAVGFQQPDLYVSAREAGLIAEEPGDYRLASSPATTDRYANLYAYTYRTEANRGDTQHIVRAKNEKTGKLEDRKFDTLAEAKQEMSRLDKLAAPSTDDDWQAFLNGSLASSSYGQNGRPAIQTTEGRILEAPGIVLFSSTAYHGTPHKVDKFSTDKIGTGEGVQAFGWGLYMAEAKGTAEFYRDALSNRGNYPLLDGVILDQNHPEYSKLSPQDRSAIDLLSQHNGDVQKTEKYLSEIHGATKPHAIIPFKKVENQYLSKKLNEIRKFDGRVKPPTSAGNLYTVTIKPDDAELLDWDGRVAEHDEITKKVNAHFFKKYGERNYWQGGSQSGQMFYRSIGKAVSQEEGKLEQFGTQTTSNEDRIASKFLAEAGVKGIRYLDGNSRVTDARIQLAEKAVEERRADAKSDPSQINQSMLKAAEGYLEKLKAKDKGSYNYVIFDGNDIDILEENGQPVKAESLFSSPIQQPDLFAAANAPDAAATLGDVKAGKMNALRAYRSLTAKRDKGQKLDAKEEQQLLDAEQALGQKMAFDMEAARSTAPATDNQSLTVPRPEFGQNRRDVQDEMSRAGEIDSSGQISLLASPEPAFDPVAMAMEKAQPIYRKVYGDIMAGDSPADVMARYGLNQKQVTNIINQMQARIQVASKAAAGTLQPKVNEEGKFVGGRPDLAEGAKPDFVAVDQIRNAEDIPEIRSRKQVMEQADARLAKDYEGEFKRLEQMSIDGNPPEDIDVAIAKEIFRHEAISGGLTDPARRARVALFRVAYRDMGSEQARAFSMRQDEAMPPAMRNAMSLTELLFEPSPQTRDRIKNARKDKPTIDAIMKQWMEKIDKFKSDMKAQGIDIDASLAAFREHQQAIKEAEQVHSGTKEAMDKAMMKLSEREKTVIRLIRDGAKLSGVKRSTGMSKEQIMDVKHRFGDEWRKAIIDAGKRFAANSLASSPSGDVYDMVMTDLGWQTDQDFDDTAPDYIQKQEEKRKEAKKRERQKATRTRAPRKSYTPEQQAAIMEGWKRFQNAPPSTWATFWQEEMKTLTPIVGATGFAEFQGEALQPWKDLWQAEMDAITDPAGRMTFEEWVNKPAADWTAKQADLLDERLWTPEQKAAWEEKTSGLFHPGDPAPLSDIANEWSRHNGAWINKATEWFKMSILSGPQTMLVNASGGLHVAYDLTLKRAVEASWNSLLSLIGQGDVRSATFSEFLPMIKNVRAAMQLSARNAFRAWELESPVFDSYAEAKPIQLDFSGLGNEYAPPNLGMNSWRELVNDPSFKKLAGAINRTMRNITFRELTAVDEFWKGMYSQLDVAAMSHRIAAKEEKLTGDAYAARVNELMQPGSIAWLREVPKAKKITFQDNLVYGKWTKEDERRNPAHKAGSPMTWQQALKKSETESAWTFLDALAVKAMEARKTPFLGPILHMFALPFITTPKNLIQRGLEVTPVGLFVDIIDGMRSLRRRMISGQITKEESLRIAGELYNKTRFIETLTNQSIGVMVYLLAEALTGGDDDDKRPHLTGTTPFGSSKEGERDMQDAVMPAQSIRIGNTIIPYGRIEPFSTFLSAYADLAVSRQRNDGFNAKVVTDQIVGAKEQLKNKLFLKGLGDIIRVIENPTRGGDRLAANYATGFIPNVIRQPIRETDELRRDANPLSDDGFFEAVAKRVGYSVRILEAPPQIDVWGNPIKAHRGELVGGHKAIDGLFRIFDPTNTLVGMKPDELDAWIFRYNLSTPDMKDRISITPIDRTLRMTIPGEKKQREIDLSPAEHLNANKEAGRMARDLLGSGWNKIPATPEEAERVVKTVRGTQARVRAKLRQQKLIEILNRPAEE